MDTLGEKLRVLLVDDDKNIRQTLRVSLKGLGCDVEIAESAEEAFKILKKDSFDFLLTDQKMKGKTGVELIEDTRSLIDPPVIVVMTAYASFENAVSAIQAGAFDYLPKPFSNSQLAHVLGKVRTLVNLKRENIRLKSQGDRPDMFRGMISPSMQRLQDFVARVAPTDATVLLIGESGTGKTELARLMHLRSSRAGKPFGVVNCGTLTESLLESELFGHVRGAFTGAVHDHIGRLESANGGTVLIDEVGELSLSAQTRLLRFLQERVIERVGANRSIPIDVRIIAATNKKLTEEVAENRFREDLYFRLNVFECEVVPLRYRKDDLPALIERFLGEFSIRSRASAGRRLSAGARKLMLDYAWPGNIRELRNVIERSVLLSRDEEIQPSDLPDSVREPGKFLTAERGGSVLRSLEDVEREHIQKVLALEPNQERAAEILGITTVTLWRKRKEYGLP